MQLPSRGLLGHFYLPSELCIFRSNRLRAHDICSQGTYTSINQTSCRLVDDNISTKLPRFAVLIIYQPATFSIG